MKIINRIFRLLNKAVDLTVLLALLLAGIYSFYALWDNRRVYDAAETVRMEISAWKPDPVHEQDHGDSFDRLRKINPDVCAWITLDGTKIDYPVLQGRDNLCYINTDVYGNFALAGSIFLDSRNDTAFRDGYSVLYGHHMENSKMFGDLDLYKDQSFFADTPAGMLILPDGCYRLEIFACISVSASEKMIFEPERWQTATKTDLSEWIGFVTDRAEQLRSEVPDRMIASATPPRILAMSTCSSAFTDARTVVLAVMEPCDE